MIRKTRRTPLLAFSLLTTLGVGAAVTGCAKRSHDHKEFKEVHLGNQMYELQRRFSALWFAGNAGAKEMVEYQAHEIYEVMKGMRHARPMVDDIDIVARLQTHVVDKMPALDKAVKDGDKEAFQKVYKEIMNNCNACHVETNHWYINVKIPEYNPYPNLEFTE